MRYHAATARELNQLAEAHFAAQRPSPELDLPPANFAQVLCWLDDLEPIPYPVQAQFDAARALPRGRPWPKR